MGIKNQKFSNAWDGVAHVSKVSSSVILAKILTGELQENLKRGSLSRGL